MKKFLSEKWLFLMIIIQPFLDMLAYFQYDSPIGTMAGYLRLGIMLMVPLYVLLTTKSKSFIALMGVIALYCAAHIGVCFINGYKSIFTDLSYMLKVVQTPILGISLCYVIKEEKHQKQIVEGFVVNFIVIVVSMIIAHLTGTALYTYNDYKIGYLGWFATANAQSIILVTISCFVIYYAIKKKKVWGILLAIFSVAALLILNATKACYYGLLGIFAGLAAYYIVDLIIKGKGVLVKNLSISALSITLVITSILAYPITPRYNMDTYINGVRGEENVEIESEIKNIKQKFENEKDDDEKEEGPWKISEEEKKYLVKFYKKSLNKVMVKRFGAERVLEKYGWYPDAFSLADVRLQKRINAELIWEDSNFATHLFGFEFTNAADYDLENDYPAIYYYYGYVGLGLYLIFLGYFVYLIIKAIFTDFKGAFNLFNFILILAYGMQLGLAQFSGAILRRPNASIYLALVVALIYYRCKKLEPKKRVKE